MNTSAARRAAAATMQAWSAGNVAKAERLARDWLAFQPGDPNALQVLGAAVLKLGRADEAASHFRAADRAAPNQAPILNMLGKSLRHAGDVDGARVALRRAGALGLAEAWRGLAELETDLGDFAAAFGALQRAIELAPNSAPVHAALSQALLRRRDSAGARTHAERALALDGANQIAQLTLAQLAAEARDDVGVEALLAPLLASSATSPTNRALALGLIGEARDRAGQYAAAFGAFAEANALLLTLHGAHRETTRSPYHPQSVARLGDAVAKMDCSGWPAIAGDERQPVFLAGFPRSGTTLLDQIVSSHPQFATLEEKDLISPLLQEILEQADPIVAMETLGAEQLASMRAGYWRSAEAAGARRDGRTLIDKLPLNIIFLPLIARIFPGARVIVALRDPRDVVLSCFQQRFGMNTAMAQFLDLETSAGYYDRVMELYWRCRERLPLRVHEVRYEDVVNDLEHAARELAAFLGAPFDAAMLDFAATARRREINTPSASQVVQPLYARAVGRWRNYEAQLASVREVLDRWSARWGYAT